MHGHSDHAGRQEGKGITVQVLTFTVSIPLLYPGLQLPLDVSSGSKGGVGSLAGIHLVPCMPFALSGLHTQSTGCQNSLLISYVSERIWIGRLNTESRSGGKQAWLHTPAPYKHQACPLSQQLIDSKQHFTSGLEPCRMTLLQLCHKHGTAVA